MSNEEPSGETTASEQQQETHKAAKSRLPVLCLATLGIVYGDIGTSPLYALRECFHASWGGETLATTQGNVLGVLSLIFWALILVVSTKYLLYVMRATNKGEGGILALLALIDRHVGKRFWITALGIFGAALLYGDGMITPAISVLSAVEGLEVATPVFQPFVIPITITILVLLFFFQKHGTEKIGLLFGPVTLVWFVTIAALGVSAIIREPHVLAAVNPLHALRIFTEHQGLGFAVLGSVFLVVTGGEALYADLGHFGIRPIRIAWFGLVLPALLLNYFGQGALVLSNPAEIAHPFFHMAPRWALYPLVGLATCATVIASQAVISGAFSLTRQAVQLDEFPRVQILQTSHKEIGQIYVPVVNWILMFACIGLVLGFRSSSNLAAAYGVAVTTTMVITTLLAAIVAWEIWKWNKWVVGGITLGLLVIDLGFFGANILKFVDGGWFPLVIGGVVFTLMTTWRRGRGILHKRLRETQLPLPDFLASLARNPPVRVSGTSIFMTGRANGTPIVLLHHLKHNKALSKQVILLNVETQEIPHISCDERIEIEEFEQGFHRVIVKFGFMDPQDVPEALRLPAVSKCLPHLSDATYYVGRHTPLPSARLPGMALWRERLFAFMTRNATQPIVFFNIPPHRVVELGLQIEI